MFVRKRLYITAKICRILFKIISDIDLLYSKYYKDTKSTSATIIKLKISEIVHILDLI